MGGRIDAPLRSYEGRVAPDWLDARGRFRPIFALLPIQDANAAWFDHLGVGPDYTRREAHALFALESHMLLAPEILLGAGEPLTIASQLLGFRSNRLHAIHSVYGGADRRPVASLESVSIHVDSRRRRAAPMRPGPRARIEAVWRRHRDLPAPAAVGRAIRPIAGHPVAVRA